MASLRFTLMMVLSIAVLSGGAFAAEIFVKPDPKTGGIILDDKAGDDVTAQPQTREEYSNAFFKTCTEQDHPILKGENLEMFCGCTSAKILDTMTLEEIKTMEKPTASGQFQRNRMLMFVYTPCIAHPARALVIEQCLTNRDTLKDSTGTCTCVGDKISNYIQLEAPRVIERAISANRLDMDPMRQLLESPELEMHSKEYMTSCVAQYELGQW